MTVSTAKRVKRHIGNGVTTEFPYDFYIPNEESLEVYLTNTITDLTVQLDPSSFSVTGIGKTTFGTVTYPLSGPPIESHQTLTIRRTVKYDQNTSIRNQSGFFPDVIEDALDHLTFQTQQNAENLSRATVVPLEETTNMTLPSLADRRSRHAGWDSAGRWVALDPDNQSGTSVTALGATTPISQAERWAQRLSPEDFGAIGEDAVADTLAINRALAELAPGGTLYLRDGRTYYCQASATPLEQHWNNIPSLSVVSNASFVVGEIITGGTSGTTARVVGIDPGGVILGLRDMIGSGFTNGETITGDLGGLSTATANVAGGPFFTTHAAFELVKPVKIMGRGTLKLIGTGVSNELPFVFANRLANPIDGLRFYDLTIDLDITGNAGSGQPRGMFFVGCDNLIIDSSVTVTSSSAKGGYAIELFDCEKGQIKPTITNVSGGVFCGYTRDTVLDLVCDGFNEAVDIDKPCSNIVIKGVYRNGATGSGQFFDINASDDITIDGVLCDTGGIVVFYNGKGNIADNFADHIAGINYKFVGARGLTVADNCQFRRCNHLVNTSSLTIGNNWAAAVNNHPGVLPPYDIYIGGKWTNCSFMAVQESAGIIFNCQLRDINSPPGPANTGAVAAWSETNFALHPDAQLWSDLKISFGSSFSVDGCNRSAIDIDGASECNIRGVTLRNMATAGDITDRAIHIRNIEVRNTKGIVADNDVDCNNACQGIGFLGTGAGTPSITVYPNRIVNWLNHPYRLSGPIHQAVQGIKWAQRLGAFPVADQPTPHIPILVVPPNTGYLVTSVSWTDEVGVVLDTTDASSLRLRRFDTGGTLVGNIVNIANSTTAFPANVPVSLGEPVDILRILEAGETATFIVAVNAGLGADFQGTLLVQYLEWTE